MLITQLVNPLAPKFCSLQYHSSSGNKGSTKSTEVSSNDDVVEDYNDDLYASFYEDTKAYDSGGHFLDKLKQHLGMSVDFKSSKNGQEGIVIMHII